MQSKLMGLFLVISLSGCAFDQPIIKTVTQTVEIPVAVPCKADIPPPPALAFKTLKPEDSLYDKTRAILSDQKLHQGYETELLAALKSCK